MLPFITLLSLRGTLSDVIRTHCVQLSIFPCKEKNLWSSWSRFQTHFPVDLCTVCVCQQWQGQRRFLITGRLRQGFCPATPLICRWFCLTGGECPWKCEWVTQDMTFWNTRLGTWGSGDQGCSLWTLLIILTLLCEKSCWWEDGRGGEGRRGVAVGDYIVEDYGWVSPLGEILCCVCRVAGVRSCWG